MRFVMLFALFSLLLAGAFALPMGMPMTADEREAAALAHEATVTRIVTALKLTDAQRQALLPIFTAHVNEMITARELQTAAQPRVEQAMGALRAAVFANNGISDAVKHAVRAAEAPYKLADEKLEQAGPIRAATVWALLTTAQGACFRRMMDAPLQADDNEAWIARAAAQLPRAPRQSDRALNLFYHQYGLTRGEIARALPCGQPILAEWMKLPEQEARARRVEYTRRLLALPATGVLDTELDARTARQLRSTVLSQKALHLLNPAVPLPSPAPNDTPAVQGATTDVRVLNLVNSLYLAKEQASALAALGRRAGEEYRVVQTRRVVLAQRSIPVLRHLCDAYRAGRTPEQASLDAFASIEKERDILRAQEDTINATYLGELRKLLTENQVDMVANFVPCTVPVQSLTNPERIGQANDNTGLERALEGLRSLPEARLPRAIEKLQERVRAAYKHKHYRDEYIKEVTARIPTIIAQGRAMDDAEFQLKKCDLAQQIAVPPIPPATGGRLDRRIVDYLLSPHLPPLLEARLAGK